MISDLFSHKIHSSSEEWQEKLTELAFIFAEFDGQEYDRDEIEKRLAAISPRSSFAARDASKFRDEFSAYQSYFGLYRLELKNDRWHLFLSETAKKFLTREEPDVTSFLRLQMSLFQYPSGMGGVYYSNSNRFRIQANARDRSLEFIKKGVHLSPLRLIVTALYADSELSQVPVVESSVSVAEIYAIANDHSANKKALPSPRTIKTALQEVRGGIIKPPSRFEKRFHLLGRLGLFDVEEQTIRVRKSFGETDQADLNNKLQAFLKIKNQFNGFDNATNGEELEEILEKGDWGRYFDGVVTLSNDIVEALTSEIWLKPELPIVQQIPIFFEPAPETYSLKERGENLSAPRPYSRQRELADPEITRIKRQRRNLEHKLLLEKVDGLLRELGAKPMENDHIDLYAELPHDGGFLFEIKSGGENLLDQVRKGLSQLYEYRFRYKSKLHEEVHLCMVLPSKPENASWVIEYLCVDRQVCLCWFDQEDKLQYPEQCAPEMSYLLPS